MNPLRFALILFAASSAGFAQTAETVALLKLSIHRQSSATPAPFGFGALASVEFVQPAIGSATLRGPLGNKAIPRADSRTFTLIDPFFTLSTLEAAYPNGSYTIQVEGGPNASFALNLSATQPNVPTILNFAEGQSISNPSSYRLTWSPLQNPGATDVIVVSLESTDGTFTYSSPEPGLPGALTSASTSLDLNLPPNKSFTGDLMFLKTSQLSNTNGTIVYVGWAAATEFTLRTLGPANVVPPAIAAQPISRSATIGSSASFSVTANGGGTLAYQWRHNGSVLPDATASTLVLPSVQAFQAGSYSVTVSNSAGSITSSTATLTVTAISTEGSNARLANLSTRGLAGTGGESLIPGFVISGTASKRVLIRAIGPSLNQFGLPVNELVADPTISLIAANGGATVASNDDWGSSPDATTIADATRAAGAFALPANSRDAALLVSLPPGGYTALVTGKTATLGVAIVEVYDLDASTAGTRLVNIATRGAVGSGSQVLIPGFVVSGTAPRTYVIRGIGPTLSAFGQTGALADPVLSVYQGSTLLFSNDDWSNNTEAGNLVLAARRAGAFELPSGSADAALLVTLQPGAYTFQLSGKGSATGIGLVEVYEVP